jgi:hypothetical protein
MSTPTYLWRKQQGLPWHRPPHQASEKARNAIASPGRAGAGWVNRPRGNARSDDSGPSLLIAGSTRGSETCLNDA